MTRNLKNYRTHDFYCLNCGKRNISMMRSRGRMREKGHRKVLYCPHCRENVNHYECFDEGDVWDFKQRFEDGEFEQEAKESIKYLKLEELVLHDA